MMRLPRNYQAWAVQAENFPLSGTMREQLRFLVQYAILAPSSHNSQPWQFEIEGEEIRLSGAPDRVLPVSDPDAHYAHVGLGAALENLLIAAEYFGFKTSVAHSVKDFRLIATVHLKRSAPPMRAPDHLLHSIPRRRSNRAPYAKKPLPVDFLGWIKQQETPDIKIDIVILPEQKSRVADILLQARIALFDQKEFRKELAGYKHHNLTRSPIGMPGFTMGFSLMKSLIADIMIRNLNVIRLMKNREARLLKEETAVFLIMTACRHEPRLWVDTGRCFERILLEAARRGIESAPNAVPGSPPYLEALQSALGTAWQPQIFARLGYADGPLPRHSPRLDISHVIL